MTTHSSILVWRIPWTESLAGCSPWSQKELDMTVETGPYQLHLQPKADAPLPVKITYISAPRLQGNPPILCLWYPINLLSHCVSNFSTSSWNLYQCL